MKLLTFIIAIIACSASSADDSKGDEYMRLENDHLVHQDTSRFSTFSNEVLLDSCEVLIYGDHASSLEEVYSQFGVEILEILIERNYVPAMSFLGYELLVGGYITQNIPKGLAILDSALSMNDSDAIFYLGHYYWDVGWYKKSIELFSKGDSLGDPWSSFELSNALLFGELYSTNEFVIPKNEFREVYSPNKAIKLLEKAANLGLTEAKYNLANFYLSGFPPILEKNEVKAKSLLVQCLKDPEFVSFIEAEEMLQKYFDE